MSDSRSRPFSQRTPIKASPPRPWIARLDQVTHDTTTLFADRAVWRNTTEVAAKSIAVQEQPYFMTWITRQYVNSSLLGLRKMVDKDRRAGSFYGLIERLNEHPERLTREWFCSNVYFGMEADMDATFSRLADPLRLNHFDADIGRADQARLSNVINGIELYVNQYIAHSQHKPRAEPPTFGQLDAGIDLVGELLQKYTLILTKGWLTALVPVFQFPWQRVFDRAWTDASIVEGATES